MRNKFKILFKYSLLALPYLMLALWLIFPDSVTIFRGVRLETVTDMQQQNTISTQEKMELPNERRFLTAPQHSVAINLHKYKLMQFEYDSAALYYKNPLTKTEEIYFARGQNRFEIFCVPCHGHDGRGKGLIITKPKLKEDEEGFPQPADLTSERTKQLSDSRLFHILSSGQNLMFPVNEKLTDMDKWCIILYIRKLQTK